MTFYLLVILSINGPLRTYGFAVTLTSFNLKNILQTESKHWTLEKQIKATLSLSIQFWATPPRSTREILIITFDYHSDQNPYERFWGIYLELNSRYIL